MADGTILNPGSGGDTIWTEDVANVKGKIPRSKLALGAVDTDAGDVSSSNPLPITASALPLPTGAATEATLANLLQEGADITGASMPAGGTHARGWLSAIWKALTDRLPAALTGSGNLKVALAESTASQAVTGTVTANQGGTWTVQPGNTANTSPWLVRQSDGSNTQAVVASSGAMSESTVNATRVVAGMYGYDPSLGAGAQCVPLQVQAGTPNLRVAIVAGSSTASVRAITGVLAENSAVWLSSVAANYARDPNAAAGSQMVGLQVESTANPNLRTSLYVGATEATIKAASTAAGATDTSIVVGLSPNSPLPAGANALGSVTVTGTVAVTGTFWQATQPISGTVTANQGGAPWTVQPTDPAATSGSITAADVASSSPASLLAGQTLYTGNPTANSTVTATVSAHSSFAVVLSATWVGTVVFEKSHDGGATWVSTSLTGSGTTTAVASVTGTGANSYAELHGNAADATKIRVRCTAYTSGSISVSIQPSFGVFNILAAQSGSNWTVNLAQVAGTATAVNTGNADAGTQRVVLASNQPAVPIGTDVVATGTWANKSGVGTSAVQMTSVSNPATKGVLVKADPGNSGRVAVGLSSSVTYNSADATDGVVLAAGDSITLPITNANVVYLIGSLAGQRVAWMAL